TRRSSDLIATNSHMMLFLSNHAINDYTLPRQAISDTEEASILRLERHLVTESSPSSNQLTLDGELIQSIISSLKKHKKELRTRKHAYTYVSYVKSVNELSFSTYALSKNSPMHKKQSFFRPSNVSDAITDFSILVNGNYLIGSLQTQYETDQYTTIEHHTNHIKLTNDYS